MAELAGTTWRVESLAGSTFADGAAAEITFGADGTISGSTGVNRFRGTYRLDDDRLTVGPLMTTRMAGPPDAMERERVLLGILAKECTIRVDEDGLVIDDGDAVTRLTAKDALVVRGEAFYRERVPLLPGSTLTVTVEDVSRADASATVLAEQRIDDPPNVPIPFELTVDRSAIAPDAQLSVRARITHDDALQWASDTHNPVPTTGEPITVRMVQAGGA
jgi:uncharacterized lipoprotein YbaY